MSRVPDGQEYATPKGETAGETALADIDAVFSALAHPTRRHILLVLRFRGGQMSAGEIAARFDCAWPTVTRHLKKLEAADLVQVRRRGRERIYVLNGGRITAVAGRWIGWFEGDVGSPDADGPADPEPAALLSGDR